MKSLSVGSLFLLCFLQTQFGFAQNVGINVSGLSPNTAAILDIDAAPNFNKGLLIPRVTFSQRTTGFNPLSAAAQGLTVYQTDAGGFGEGFYFNTSTSTTPAWSFLLNNTSGWSLTGNALTTPSNSVIGTAIPAGQNYVGTSDLKDFVLATNNLERLRISSAGNVGIGTTTPATKLDLYNGTAWFHTSGGANQTNLQLGEFQDVPSIALYSFSTDDVTGDLLNIISNRYQGNIFFKRQSSGGVRNMAEIFSGSNGSYFQLYGPDADNTVKIRLDANGSSYLTGGNVGIGTNSPATTLDVNGVINSAAGYRIANAAATGNYLRGNGTNFVSSAIQAADLPSGAGNYIQNQTAADQAAGFRINGNGLFNGGQITMGTATPLANTLLTANTSATYTTGIGMTLSGGVGTGINVTSASSSYNNITSTNSGNAAATYYAVGGLLTSATLSGASTFAKGYLGYKANGSSNVAANYFAGYFQGKTAITSSSSPDGIADLEVQNTTSGAAPATVFLRQTTSLTTTANVLNNLNFGDNHSTSPQAQIQIIRGAAGGASDLPTDMAFSTTPDASATLTERMRIMNNGNVGIGTTAPGMKLDVSGDIRAYNSANSFLYLSASGANSRANLSLSSSTGASVNREWRIVNELGANLTFLDMTASQVRMVINTSGNVGIGSTAPAYKLDVAGDINLTGALRIGAAAGTVGQVLTSAAGGANTWTTPATGTLTAITGTAPIVSSGGNTPAISITQSGTAANGFLSSTDWNTFNNKPGGSGTTNYLVRWTSSTALGIGATFDNGTNVGIGTTSPGYKLHVNDPTVNGMPLCLQSPNTYTAIRFQNSVSSYGFIQYTNNNLEFYANSGNFPTMTIAGGSPGNVGIGTTTPDASSLLDITSTSKGLLIPRVALTAINAAGPITAPLTSLMVYNTATAGVSPNIVVPGYYYWNGSKWISVSGGSGGNDWSLLGNAGTTGGPNFLGTTDNISLRLRTNNIQRMIIDSLGNVGIGTASPAAKLVVNAGTTGALIDITTNGGVHGEGNTILQLRGLNGATPGQNTARLHFGYHENDPMLRVNGGPIYIYSGTWHFGPRAWFPSGITSTHSSRLRLDGMTDGAIGNGGAATTVIDFTERDISIASLYDAGGHLPEFRIWQPNATSNFIHLRPGRETVFSSGSVGIGTTSPSTQLHTTGGVRFQILAGTGSRMVVADASGNLAAGSSIAAGIVTGSGTLNYVPKWTPNGNTLDNSSIFDNGTNVGIGTIAPSSKLDVRGTLTVSNSSAQYVRIGNTYNNPVLTVTDGSSLNSPPGYLNGGYGYYSMGISANSFFNPGSGVWSNPVITTSPSWAAFITSCGDACSFPGDNFTIRRAPPVSGAPVWSDFFTINAAGNAGIGTTSPLQKLHIISNAQAERAIIVAGSILDNNWGGGITFTSFNNTTTNSYILVSTNGLDINNTLATPIRLFTNNTEQVRILSNGNVGIGTTSPSTQLHTTGSVRFQTLTGTGNRFVITDLNGNISAGAATTAGIVTGSGTLNYVPKWTPNGATLGSSLIFDNGTNVGIGTASPGALLQIGEAPNHYFRFETNAGLSDYYNTETTPRWRIAIDQIGSGLSAYTLAPPGTTIAAGGVALGIAASQNLGLYTSNGSALTERLRINGSGNVGIGTTNPGAKLEIAADNSAAIGLLVNRSSGLGSGPAILKAVSVTQQSNNNTTSTIGIDATVAHNLGQGGTVAVKGTANSIIYSTNGAGIGVYGIGNQADMNGAGIAIGVKGEASGVAAGGGGSTYAGYFDNTTAVAGSNFGLYVSTTASGTYGIYQNGNVKNYFSGNVGIGTTSPTAQLDVYNPTLNNSAFQGRLRVGVNNSSESANGSFNEAAPSYGIEFTRDWVNGGQRTLQAGIYAWGNGGWGSGLAFRTAATGGTMGTRMVITDAGSVGIGTTSPGAKLEIVGQIKITGGAPGAGKVLTSDAAGLATWNTPSSGSVAGSGILNYVPKWTPDGNTLGNSSIFDNGNVGIGTISPTAQLDVYNPTLNNSAFQGRLRVGVNNSSESANGSFNEAAPSYGIEFTRDWVNGGQRTLQAGIYAWGNGGWGSGLAFRTAATGGTMGTRMVITDAGSVGIGTTSPGARLQTGDYFTNLGGRLLTSNAAGWVADGVTPQVVISGSTANTNNGSIIGLALHNDNPTVNSYSPIISFSRRSNSTSYNSTFAAISGQSTGQGPDANWVAGDLVFSTQSSSYMVEKMRILSNGNVGIGATAPGYQLSLLGAGQVGSALTNTGNTGSMLLLNATDQGPGSGGGVLFGVNNGTYTSNSFFAGIKGSHTNGSSNQTGDLTFTLRNAIADLALTERMRITAAGNVGIGTTAPAQLLHVYTTVADDNGGHIKYENANAGTGSATNAQIIGKSKYGTLQNMVWENYGARIGMRSLANSGAGDVYFTSGADAIFMVGKASGNVGIGTTSPGARLQTGNYFTNLGGRLLTSNAAGWVADGVTPEVVISSSTANTNNGSVIGLALHNDNSTVNTYSPIIAFSRRSNSASYNSTFAAISGQATGQGPDANWVAGDLVFSTQSSSYMVEKMRILSNGNVGIGTTSPTSTLDVNGTISGNYQGFSYSAAGAAAPNGWNNVIIPTLDYNTFGAGSYNTTTGAFTAPKTGYYRFILGGWMSANTAGNDRYAIGIAVNGALRAFSGGQFSSGDSPTGSFTHMVRLNAGDIVQPRVFNSIAAITLGSGGGHQFWFQGEFVGK